MREESKKWGMVYSPYPPYEILKTKNISYNELNILKKIEHMVDKYLNSGKFYNILNFFNISNRFVDIFEFYYELSNFFDSKGYFKRSIASIDYYYLFVEFNDYIKAGDQELLLDIIRYEYFSYNNTKWVPDFLRIEMCKSEERSIKEYVMNKKSIDNINKISVFKFNNNIKSFIQEGKKDETLNYIAFISNDSKERIFIQENELKIQ